MHIVQLVPYSIRYKETSNNTELLLLEVACIISKIAPAFVTAEVRSTNCQSGGRPSQRGSVVGVDHGNRKWEVLREYCTVDMRYGRARSHMYQFCPLILTVPGPQLHTSTSIRDGSKAARLTHPWLLWNAIPLDASTTSPLLLVVESCLSRRLH